MISGSQKYAGAKADNSYRYGVLIGNHVEDRFGKELKSKLVSCCVMVVHRLWAGPKRDAGQLHLRQRHGYSLPE